MLTELNRLRLPELFFGFVAPIGADLSPSIEIFKRYFKRERYRVVEVKVTDLFQLFKPYVVPTITLMRTPSYERFKSYISYGNQLRETSRDNATLAVATIRRLIRKRGALPADKTYPPFEGTVYLLYQFKRKEEIDLLRSVYGRLFFQISAYSRRGARVEALARTFARSAGAPHSDTYKERAEEIVKQDANEADKSFGQRVSKIFHDADFIINLDSIEYPIERQIERFCEILFSSNKYPPTKMEYGMNTAKAAAMRSLDLSRQVGAAIFSEIGEVTSLGSNEVPKAFGGTYWADDKFDARDYTLGYDPNQIRKQQQLVELIKLINPDADIEKLSEQKDIRDSQMMDALEYGRVIHAEMNALIDAARLGRAIKGAHLYCTTFPCHMCAKQIISAGISKVVFLEPYPKSLIDELHLDAAQIEHAERGNYSGFPAVSFEHFYGITPRRFRDFFARGERKNDAGDFEEYRDGEKIPFIDIKRPYYSVLETEIEALGLKAGIKAGIFDEDG